MTTYVSPHPWTDSDGRVWFHFWADSSDEAVLILYAVGGDISTRLPDETWEAYRISAEQFAAALTLGAELTDFFGPAEFVARAAGDHKRLRWIARARLT